MESTARHRVLVVEDNVDAAEALATLLSIAGHRAEAVHTAHAAIERLSASAADVALVDIGLPDMNGYELARRIRAIASTTYLVALTGYGQEEAIERARQAGFDAHILKPADLTELERELALVPGGRTSALR